MESTVGFFLPNYDQHLISPNRLRDEYLVRLLIIAAPIFMLGFMLSFWQPIEPNIIVRGIAVALPIFALILIKLNRSSCAVGCLFLGIALLSIANYALDVIAAIPNAYSPLLAITLFTAITMVGLFSGSSRALAAMAALGIALYLFDWIFQSENPFDALYSRVTFLSLHLIAIILGRYLLVFFDRIFRLAEARRIMNRRLEELVAEARTAGAVRLESFSHDMRSPLTGILGIHELLADTTLDETQTKYLSILGKSITLLRDIAESVLSDTGENDIAPDKLFSLVLEPFKALARAKGVELRRFVVGSPPPLPLPPSDAIRAVSNLVDNALKYTNSGEICLSAAVEVTDKGKNLVLSVLDTGQGIDTRRLSELKARSIAPDPQIASSRGLGLSNVRRLISQAGGVMEISSLVGRGTTIMLRFPIS